MTTTAAPVQLWSTMPGWGIAADLTPPELIASRHLKTLRRWLAAGLVLLLVAGLGCYVVAARRHSAALADLRTVQARTSNLQSEEHQYAGVTQMQGSVSQIQAQLATLMGGDVDLVTLMGRLRSALPAPMTISSEVVMISLAGVAAAPSGGATPALTTIGTVTISGTGHALDNLAAYVDHLQAIAGVSDVTPTTNSVSAAVVHYSLTLSLTTALLSHRFDVSTKHTR